MNLLLLKMGPMRYRGGGGGGGGGGDGGDSGDSGDGIGDGISPSAGPGAGPGAPGTGPSSNGDVGEGNSSPGAPGVGSSIGNGNGIAGMLGIDNPGLANAVNGIIGNVTSNAVGMPGIVGMANAAINGSSGQAASAIGSAIGGIAAGPVGAAIGGIAGNAIGNAPGVPAGSVPGDPSGGAGRENSPISAVPGQGILSGGLGMNSTGSAQPSGSNVLGMYSDPVIQAPINVGRAGDYKADNPLVRALRSRLGLEETV